LLLLLIFGTGARHLGPLLHCLDDLGVAIRSWFSTYTHQGLWKFRLIHTHTHAHTHTHTHSLSLSHTHTHTRTHTHTHTLSLSLSHTHTHTYATHQGLWKSGLIFANGWHLRTLVVVCGWCLCVCLCVCVCMYMFVYVCVWVCLCVHWHVCGAHPKLCAISVNLNPIYILSQPCVHGQCTFGQGRDQASPSPSPW
jgi:hypothetical protein